MKCIFCGNEVAKGNSFCTRCGYAVPKKKSNTGLIIGISITGGVLLILFLLFVFVVVRKIKQPKESISVTTEEPMEIPETEEVEEIKEQTESKTTEEVKTVDSSKESELDSALYNEKAEKAYQKFMLKNPYLAEAVTEENDIPEESNSKRTYTKSELLQYTQEPGRKDGVIGCTMQDVNQDGKEELISISVESKGTDMSGEYRTETIVDSVKVDVFQFNGSDVTKYGETLVLEDYYYSDWALSSFDIVLSQGENGMYLTSYSYKSKKSDYLSDQKMPFSIGTYDLSDEKLTCLMNLTCDTSGEELTFKDDGFGTYTVNAGELPDEIREHFLELSLDTLCLEEYANDTYFGFKTKDSSMQNLVSMYVSSQNIEKLPDGKYIGEYVGTYWDWTGCRNWLKEDAGSGEMIDADENMIEKADSQTKETDLTDAKAQEALAAYKEFLSAPTIDWAGDGGILAENTRYSFGIIYVDHDDVPELVLYNDGSGDFCHATGYAKVFTYRNGSMIDLDMYACDFMYYEKTGIIVQDDYAAGLGTYYDYHQLNGETVVPLFSETKINDANEGTEFWRLGEDSNGVQMTLSEFQSERASLTNGQERQNVTSYNNTEENRERLLN